MRNVRATCSMQPGRASFKNRLGNHRVLAAAAFSLSTNGSLSLSLFECLNNICIPNLMGIMYAPFHALLG